jgi:hypothetical protein
MEEEELYLRTAPITLGDREFGQGEFVTSRGAPNIFAAAIAKPNKKFRLRDCRRHADELDLEGVCKT